IKFSEWLKLKELMVDPQTQTQILGAAVGATDPKSPANVADRLAALNSPLTLAIMTNPRALKVQAAADTKNKAKNPAMQNMANNIVPSNIGSSMNPGTPN